MAAHDLVFQVTTTADRQKVREALTTADDIRGWWTGEVAIDGDDLRPSFPGMPQPFELKTSTPARDRLVWTVGDYPPFWAGTRCEWVTSAADDEAGTRIDMAHRGFESTNPLIGSFTMEWARILDHLVAYVETGTPDPRTPSHP